MTLSTRYHINAAFKNALQEHLKRALRTGDDWDRFHAIQRETDARLIDEDADFKRDYTRRIADAVEIILREENGLRLDKPLPEGALPHSDSDTLWKKAEIWVRRDHESRRASIIRDEAYAFLGLSKEIRARDAPTAAFKAKQGEELYTRGKQDEAAYHKPVREAEIATRNAEKLQAQSQHPTYGCAADKFW